MRIRTVTTSDRTLLESVREVVRESDSVLLCVAFASEAGLRLLERELVELNERPRLCVTTVFESTNPATLALA